MCCYEKTVQGGSIIDIENNVCQLTRFQLFCCMDKNKGGGREMRGKKKGGGRKKKKANFLKEFGFTGWLREIFQVPEFFMQVCSAQTGCISTNG